MTRKMVSERTLDLFLRECVQQAEKYGIDAVTISAAMETTEEGEHISNGFALHNRMVANAPSMLATCQNNTIQNVAKTLADLAKAAAEAEANAPVVSVDALPADEEVTVVPTAQA